MSMLEMSVRSKFLRILYSVFQCDLVQPFIPPPMLHTPFALVPEAPVIPQSCPIPSCLNAFADGVFSTEHAFYLPILILKTHIHHLTVNPISHPI